MDSVSASRQRTLLAPPLLGDHVADAIRLVAVGSQKFFRKSGVEVGGLLTANPDSGAQLRVDGLELVPCEHLYGPTYHLSRLDCQGLKTQAAIIKASGLKIAGYFRTCLRPEFAVMPEDYHRPGNNFRVRRCQGFRVIGAVENEIARHIDVAFHHHVAFKPSGRPGALAVSGDGSRTRTALGMNALAAARAADGPHAWTIFRVDSRDRGEAGVAVAVHAFS